MNLRLLRRAVALALVLSAAILRYWKLRIRGPLTLDRRALWLQDTCVRVLRSMEIRSEVEGEIPKRGLVVANHLSYLDIVILSAAMPCFFVAKSEVGEWFYFGRAAADHRREGNERAAICKCSLLLCHELDRKLGLANPAGSNQGHQATLWVMQQAADCGQLHLAAEQRGG